MKKLNFCQYCDHLISQVEFIMDDCRQENSNEEEFKLKLNVMKVYYWIIIEFIKHSPVKECYFCRLNHLNSLYTLREHFLKFLSDNGQEPDTNTMACDVCRYLPNITFLLMDDACKLEKKQDIMEMQNELQYYCFLLIVCEDMISACPKCENYNVYSSVLSKLSQYLASADLRRLDEFVRYWKSITNYSNILDCNNRLNNLKRPKFTYVDLTRYTTFYFDFNVYDKYEKDQKIAQTLDRLSGRDNVKVIYSLSHLEEVSRMNNEKYENIRLNSLKTMTNGYTIFGNNSNNIAFCTCDFDSFYNYAKHYREMNNYAEVEECNYSSLQNSLVLKKYIGKYNPDMGNHTLSEIVSNAKAASSGSGKYIPGFPSIEDMNAILKVVGVERKTIGEYDNLFSKKDLSLHDIRISILSLSRLMFIIGLHNDKITKKDDLEAGYPIYGKSSYRTIRSGYYDIDHLMYASKCTYFVTNDCKLSKRANDIYGFLGIKTKPISLSELSALSSNNDLSHSQF